MRSIKIGKKTKMLFLAALLLTASIFLTSLLTNMTSNQYTYQLITSYMPYMPSVPQAAPPVTQEKIEISSDYNFSENLYKPIVVVTDNIVIDGNGYTLQGSGSGCGFNLTGRSNVTIKNVIVNGWIVGFYLENCSNNTLLSNIVINGGNTQSGGNIGFHLVSSSNNTLSSNKANNNGWGFVLESSSNNTLLSNTARDNYYSGFYLNRSSYNNLLDNTAANNRLIGFLLECSSYNSLTANTASYNGRNGFALWSNCSYNVIMDNLVVNFWDVYGFESFSTSESAYDNIIENNTVISTGLSVLGTLYGAYIFLNFYRYSVFSVSPLLMVGSLVLVAVILICSVVVQGKRKGISLGEGIWRLFRDTFSYGIAGGITGAVTAVMGIIWVTIVNAFLAEINTYLMQLSYFLMILIPPSWLYSYIYYGYYPFLIVPFYPSASLFGISSVIFSTFLVATGILIVVGLYGIHKAGEEAIGLGRLILGTIGIISGALLIIGGTLTTGYMYTHLIIGVPAISLLPVPTPNFNLIWTGFMILGFASILLGSASVSIRKMTQKPSASNAAGILSIIGAIIFIGGFLWPVALVVGFILILAASILWTVVFFSFPGTITS